MVDNDIDPVLKQNDRRFPVESLPSLLLFKFLEINELQLAPESKVLFA